MIRENQVIGAVGTARPSSERFDDRQVALIKTFADQAVIAIENTRLLNELRESLDRQTATSEVLQLISSSPGELQAVFETMLAKATRLCEASYGALWYREDDAFRIGAFHGPLPEIYTEQWRSGPPYQPELGDSFGARCQIPPGGTGC